MIILKRFTPYWTTAVIGLCLFGGFLLPDVWRWVLVGLLSIPIVQVLIYHQPKWRLDYVGFSSPMLLLLLSTYGFVLMQESIFWSYLSVGITIILFFLFTKNLAIFLYQPAKYIPYSLEHISTYSNVVASFFLYVSIFMFFILGVGRLRYMLLVGLVGTLIVVWQTFWIQKISWKRSKWYAAIISLVAVEAIWVLHFWPVSYFTSGLLLTIGLYMLLHISRHYVSDTLTRQRSVRYILIASITSLVLLLTTQWI
jgi:hypothetical protein